MVSKVRLRRIRVTAARARRGRLLHHCGRSQPLMGPASYAPLRTRREPAACAETACLARRQRRSRSSSEGRPTRHNAASKPPMVQTIGQNARIAALSIARLHPAITQGLHTANAGQEVGFWPQNRQYMTNAGQYSNPGKIFLLSVNHATPLSRSSKLFYKASREQITAFRYLPNFERKPTSWRSSGGLTTVGRNLLRQVRAL